MYSRKALAVVVFFCLPVSLSLACGPFFPWQLLSDRVAMFKAAPANRFVFEAARIAPPPRTSWPRSNPTTLTRWPRRKRSASRLSK